MFSGICIKHIKQISLSELIGISPQLSNLPYQLNNLQFILDGILNHYSELYFGATLRLNTQDVTCQTM